MVGPSSNRVRHLLRLSWQPVVETFGCRLCTHCSNLLCFGWHVAAAFVMATSLRFELSSEYQRSK